MAAPLTSELIRRASAKLRRSASGSARKGCAHRRSWRRSRNARRDPGAVRNWLTRARKLITIARRAAAEATVVTPNAGGWLALAEAEYARARRLARPESWSQAAEG
jgi:hypothetical protein